MAQVTMEQLMDFRNSDDFFGTTVIPLKGAYKINKIKKAVEQEAEFYSTKFQEIVDKYAQKDESGQVKFSEDGDQILVQEDKVAECNQALEDLQNMTVEIDNLNLTLADLGDNLQCTPEQLEALMPFVTE